MATKRTRKRARVRRSKYEQIREWSALRFRRLTGVKPTVFTKMVIILKRSERARRKRGGRPPMLSLEDRLLLALEYLREYRTYFHIGESYGVSESQAYKICRWVEDTLIQDKQFALPGKKALLQSNTEYEVVLIDATESPIERPKKDRNGTTLGRRNGTPSRAKSSSTERPSTSSAST